MFGKKQHANGKAIVTLAIWLAAGAMLLLPNSAGAQVPGCCTETGYGQMLYSPSQSNTTLRNPLIPGALNSAPLQPAYASMPPPMGSGPVPLPEMPGDLGGPMMPPSGMADQTHGNIFGTRSGPGPTGPMVYVPGAGRRVTINGQDQGVYDYGQQEMGTSTTNNGGAASGAQNSGPGGQENGTNVQNNGGAASGASDVQNNGGASSGSTNVQNNGGASSGSTDVQNNGGASSGSTNVQNNGGASSGSTDVQNNGGAAASSASIVNNGGPAPGAQQDGDVLFQHAQQPSRYDFDGVLPTVRTFSRYLVILGVVFGTVFITLAGWSIVFGSQYGGARAIGAVGGLLLLLSGYTIWKIVEMNTFHANSTGVQSTYRNGSPQQGVNTTPGSTVGSGNGPVAPAQAPPGGGNAGGGNAGGGNAGGGNAGGGNAGGGNAGGGNAGGGNAGGGNAGGGNAGANAVSGELGL